MDIISYLVKNFHMLKNGTTMRLSIQYIFGSFQTTRDNATKGIIIMNSKYDMEIRKYFMRKEQIYMITGKIKDLWLITMVELIPWKMSI